MTKSTSMKPIKCIALSLLLSLTAISSAQPGKFEISMDFGPGLIDMWPVGDGLYTPEIGVSANIFFQYNVNNLIAIKSGLSYDLKGTGVFNNTYFPAPFLVSGGDVMLHYLTLPILAKATFGKKIKFFLDVGPYLSVLVHAYERDESGNNLYKHGDLKPYDSGIQADIGFAIPINNYFEFSFENRSSLGLLNIGDYNRKTLSSAFLIGFNYKFGKVHNTSKTSHT
jgi:hypothetical protein